MATPFDQDDEGNITTCPLLGFAAAPASGIAIIVRLEFARTPAQLEDDGEALQLHLTPKQARDLCRVLVRQADHVLSQHAPRGTAS